ncbi:MarR family winged helix-turn-helix transcriptional regulator [Mannheimia sp. E30BD]|uniref:MarR family winged helix-turn-helix transcriptional regulator n=1 Tax=Mannheimia sp. E30BD TaxID=3278708 RepID=UPI00359E5392
MNDTMTQADKLGQSVSHLFNLYNAWAKKKGLNYNYLAILHTLVRLHTCTQKQIGTLWALPKQTISMACQKLHADGLIDYLPSENDKREKVLTLTEQGKTLAYPLIDELDVLELVTTKQFGNQRLAQTLQNLQAYNQILSQVMNIAD